MAEWKIGDKVWFIWADTGSAVVQNIHDVGVGCGVINEHDKRCRDYEIDIGYDDEDFIIVDDSCDLWKTKNEAINAMIKYLEGLRDESNSN